MVRPDRRPILHAFHIVPHPIAIDQSAAGAFRDRQHAAVDMIRHAGDHPRRRLAQALRPVLPHQIVIAADAAGSDDHAWRLQRELSDDDARALLPALDMARLENIARDAVDRSAALRNLVHAMAEFERYEPLPRGFESAFGERLEHAGARAPGDVKTRHGIAMTHRIVAAAFGPTDDREEAQAPLAQPGSLLAGGESDIGFGPSPRPKILVAVKARCPHPVFERQVVRIADAHPPLFGRIDKEQAAEGPERLPAERLLRLLVEDDDFSFRLG